jgi:RNA polymerase sigma-70 factor (ECF subfamily)
MNIVPANSDSPSEQFAIALDGLLRAHEGALSEVLNLYRPYLLATARRRLERRLRAKAGPSDLVQETVIEAARAWYKLDAKPRTEPEIRMWLRNILLERLKVLRRRYYRAKSRSLRRERSLDEGESRRLIEQLITQSTEAPSENLNRKELASSLIQALDRLNPAYRQVIIWRNRDGFKFSEIGQRMDRSADAARMLWRRAIRQLREEMELNNGSR